MNNATMSQYSDESDDPGAVGQHCNSMVNESVGPKAQILTLVGKPGRRVALSYCYNELLSYNVHSML